MEFKKYKLSDLASVDISGVDKKSYEGEKPVRLCNFTDVYKNWAITEYHYPSLMKATAKDRDIEKFKIKKGQVAITKDSETRDDIGIPTYIADNFEDVILGYHCALITPSDALDGKYLNAYLNTKMAKKYFEGYASGSGQRYTLTLDSINDIQIWMPDIEDQRKLSKILNDIDKKIALNTRMNAELEAMAKQLYDYWFVQFDFPDENGKPYKSSGGKMVYNPTLKREIPAGWEVRNLFYIANYYNGLACQNYRPSEGEDSLPVIKITEMHNGFTSETERASSNIPTEAIIENGDVLFAWSASLEVMLWGLGKGALNQHIFKVTSNNGFPKSFYFYQLLEYVGHFKKIAEAKKTTMGHITKDHLEQSQIVIPPTTDLPNQLEEKLVPIMDKIVSLSSERIYLTYLRDSLLPMLMNGQVTVK
jgi:type I restriction enzyme S subunit